MKDPSDSSEHSALEETCLAYASAQVKAALRPEPMRLRDGTCVQIDGVDKRTRVLCEVSTHVGKLKDGQRKKLAKDLLKLLMGEHALGGSWSKILCVTDEPAWKFLTGKSWCAAAAREFKVKVLLCSLKPAERARLGRAQVSEAEGMRR